MDKELKEHFEKIDKRFDNIEKNMATKADISMLATKAEIGTLATKSDLKKVHDSLMGYLEHIDESLQEHKHDTEAHKQVSSL